MYKMSGLSKVLVPERSAFVDIADAEQEARTCEEMLVVERHLKPNCEAASAIRGRDLYGFTTDFPQEFCTWANHEPPVPPPINKRFWLTAAERRKWWLIHLKTSNPIYNDDGTCELSLPTAPTNQLPASVVAAVLDAIPSFASVRPKEALRAIRVLSWFVQTAPHVQHVDTLAKYVCALVMFVESDSDCYRFLQAHTSRPEMFFFREPRANFCTLRHVAGAIYPELVDAVCAHRAWIEPLLNEIYGCQYVSFLPNHMAFAFIDNSFTGRDLVPRIFLFFFQKHPTILTLGVEEARRQFLLAMQREMDLSFIPASFSSGAISGSNPIMHEQLCTDSPNCVFKVSDARD